MRFHWESGHLKKAVLDLLSAKALQ